MVTGGLGGLGLIASFHCANEFDNPIITTSRSGKLGTGGGPSAFNMYEAMKEIVPVFNVRLDVSKSKDTADIFAWLSRPALPPEDSKLFIDDIIHQLKYKMNQLPDEALRLLQEFLLEVKEKLSEVIYEMRSRETKIDHTAMAEVLEKEANVTTMIGILRSKVGFAERTGRCKLRGGMAPGSYSVPEQTQAIADKQKVEGRQLTDRASVSPAQQRQPTAISGGTLAQIMQEEKRLMNSGAARH